jgi:hypothetical protein
VNAETGNGSTDDRSLCQPTGGFFFFQPKASHAFGEFFR